MQKITMFGIFLVLCLSMGACSTDTDTSDVESISEPSQSVSESSVLPSVSSHPPAETSKSEAVSSSSSVTSSSTSSSVPAESKPQASNNENPVTEKAPTISASGFYEDAPGASVSILIPGEGRFALSYEKSKEFFSGIDLSTLSPTTEKYDIDMQSANPGIVFTGPRFEHELRLDKNTNIAIYVVNGSTTYYYTMPSGFYDTAYKRVEEYMQYDYNANEGAPDKDNLNGENIDVTTG